jgi:hypothetical protein
VRYCFRVADDAEEFQAMYGGVVLMSCPLSRGLRGRSPN